MKKRMPKWLPGDPSPEKQIKSMLRVNHAGEYGAKRIYEGQIAAFQARSENTEEIEHMYEQEQKHLDFFHQEVLARDIRPTALMPLWHILGYTIGFVTARFGMQSAMICTVAVEDAISDHYLEQMLYLKKMGIEPALASTIETFRAEEMEHHDLGAKHCSTHTTPYNAIFYIINTGSKIAISLSKRI